MPATGAVKIGGYVEVLADVFKERAVIDCSGFHSAHVLPRIDAHEADL
jgi:hypothetical protein